MFRGVRKILNMRLFEDEAGKMWKCSVKEKDYEVLCLSQITLYHRLKGNKPDFHLAMAPELSKSFYGKFLEEMRNNYCEERIKATVIDGNYRTIFTY
uniref:D-aminoacyl-tRNA deacylase n=1 Tax=Rhodnius prolixus TaxID=13249 RepID=T1HFA3_RHOPR